MNTFTVYRRKPCMTQPGVFIKKRKISKTRTPYNIRTQNKNPRAWGLRQGFLFFRKKIDFPSRNGEKPCEGFEARIVTINNIDGVSGLRTAHTRWAQKYPSFFDQILNPLFGCKKPIMSPWKNCLHFGHIAKNPSKKPFKN